jgi:hypothetical protein
VRFGVPILGAAEIGNGMGDAYEKAMLGEALEMRGDVEQWAGMG